ncbi:O-acetyl-ADP-ribose deacetylase [Streptomyces alboniger]|uniref:O-acetyl-ADP-ribose deacetylase n=1 Tax=Streptomyces alboniger TaxID=132473 RepID=A0A5J6HLK1_STRAD|nr:O-acetyl-ADP-ribose deacetylase [Streptomyces alboniger]QEV21189.1 O-acetyl-ADP-ribose deacetylase [Streptomyces alboniger]
MTVSITLVQGDLTRQRVDALVNAANSSLLGGGGVDGAIHRRGGPEILADCRRLRASLPQALNSVRAGETPIGKGLPTGRAVATVAGKLDAGHVIHTVGPVWSATEDRSELLASCHREALRVAAELGARTVAFPAISTGVYRWPLDDAARVAVRTVREAADPALFDEVRFVLFDRAAYDAFAEALAASGDATEN